jgi:hypothetical protein
MYISDNSGRAAKPAAIPSFSDEPEGVGEEAVLAE